MILALRFLSIFFITLAAHAQEPVLKNAENIEYFQLIFAFLIVLLLLGAAVFFLRKNTAAYGGKEISENHITILKTSALSRSTYASLVNCNSKSFLVIHNASSCSVHLIDSSNQSQ